MTAVPERERGPVLPPPHDGEDNFGRGNDRCEEARQAELEASALRPSRRQSECEGGADQVRATVAHVDPGGRAVVEEETDAAESASAAASTRPSPWSMIARPPPATALTPPAKQSSPSIMFTSVHQEHARPRPRERDEGPGKRVSDSSACDDTDSYLAGHPRPGGGSIASSAVPSARARTNGTTYTGRDRATPTSNPAKIPIPPRYGTAFSCGLSDPGRSTTPRRLASHAADGVKTTAATKAPEAGPLGRASRPVR